MTCSITALRNSSFETSSLCCVEITTQSTRAGFPSRYSTVTCDFPSRTKEGELFVLADFRESLCKAVCQLNLVYGHQFFGFIAGISKHQALIASSTRVYAHCNVRRLPLHRTHHSACVGVKTIQRIIVTNFVDCFADQVVVIDLRAGRNLSRDDHEAGC